MNDTTNNPLNGLSSTAQRHLMGLANAIWDAAGNGDFEKASAILDGHEARNNGCQRLFNLYTTMRAPFLWRTGAPILTDAPEARQTLTQAQRDADTVVLGVAL